MLTPVLSNGFRKMKIHYQDRLNMRLYRNFLKGKKGGGLTKMIKSYASSGRVTFKRDVSFAEDWFF